MPQTVTPRGRETRHSSAWVADIRMIAMALRKITYGDRNKSNVAAGMAKIIEVCDGLIASGPREYHHVLERSATLEAIQHELERTAFPRHGR